MTSSRDPEGEKGEKRRGEGGQREAWEKREREEGGFEGRAGEGRERGKDGRSESSKKDFHTKLAKIHRVTELNTDCHSKTGCKESQKEVTAEHGWPKPCENRRKQ